MSSEDVHKEQKEKIDEEMDKWVQLSHKKKTRSERTYTG
jgi:hypothetical protein